MRAAWAARASFPLFLCALAGASAACAGDDRQPQILLATTTSVEDSGLLQALVDGFRADHPHLRLRAMSTGTGQALELGRRKDVDAVLSHDSAAEARFVERGFGTERRAVMHNHFVIAGPPEDPAGVRGMAEAVAALARIASRRARFVSRGDDSGTHRRERQLWEAAGLRPWEEPREDRRWYLEAGLGMADALGVAAERGAYILADRGTLLTLEQHMHIEPLVAGDPRLLNRYAITLVAGSRNPEAAQRFADWLTGPRGQAVIRDFGRSRYGAPLFTPDATEPEGAQVDR